MRKSLTLKGDEILHWMTASEVMRHGDIVADLISHQLTDFILTEWGCSKNRLPHFLHCIEVKVHKYWHLQ